MTLAKLAIEIDIGDVVDGKYEVTRIKACHVDTKLIGTEKVKRFNISGGGKNLKKFQTAERNGNIYFTRNNPGGYRHGMVGGDPRWRKNKIKPYLECAVCGEVITAIRRTVYCSKLCYDRRTKKNLGVTNEQKV